jgi:hypothetical protein
LRLLAAAHAGDVAIHLAVGRNGTRWDAMGEKEGFFLMVFASAFFL